MSKKIRFDLDRKSDRNTNICIMNAAMTHGNMIIFLLLAFSVAKVWAVTGVGCEGGWINFTCENPDNILPMSRTRIIKNTVVVKNLQQDDNGALCLTPNRIEFRIENCSRSEINRTVFNKAQTRIGCGHHDSSYKIRKVYLCKETGDSGCKDVSLLNTYGKYIMSPYGHGLYVTIKNISPEDQGIYWCVEDKDLYDRSYRKYNITVSSNFSDHQADGRIGENIVLTCDEYPKGDQENKFFCKGEDPHTCDHLVQDRFPEKFTQFENSYDRINVTIFNITAEDEGTYWFGSGNVTEHRKELEIFCRLELIVGPELGNPLPAAPYLSIVTLCVCVAVVVLLVVVLVLIKNGKRRNDAPPQNNRQEEYVYEEIPLPAARKAVATVYATAEESLHYTAIDFGKSGNTSEPKPSSSHFQYGTVFNKREDTCTIQEAPSEEPLYCNVNTKN